MSEDSDGDGSASRSPQTSKRTFPELIDRLRAALAPAQESSSRDPAETLAAAKQHFDTFVRDSQPLPARHQRVATEVRRQFEMMEALQNGSPPGTQSLFDPLVRILLTLNYWYAVETAGRLAAKAELVSIVKDLARGEKGRPARISVSQVQEAMQLRDAGRSFGEIAHKLGLGNDPDDARRVRTALRHHFPDVKPTEDTSS